MGKGGYGKGGSGYSAYGKGGHSSYPRGPYSNGQHNQNNSSSSPCGSLAQSFGTFMSEIQAMGEMSRLGNILAMANAPGGNLGSGQQPTQPTALAAPSSGADARADAVALVEATHLQLLKRLEAIAGRVDCPAPTGPTNTAQNHSPEPQAGLSTADVERIITSSQTVQALRSDIDGVKGKVDTLHRSFDDLKHHQQDGFNKIGSMIANLSHSSKSNAVTGVPSGASSRTESPHSAAGAAQVINDRLPATIDGKLHDAFVSTLNLRVGGKCVGHACPGEEPLPIDTWWERIYGAKKLAGWLQFLETNSYDTTDFDETDVKHTILANISPDFKTFTEFQR